MASYYDSVLVEPSKYALEKRAEMLSGMNFKTGMNQMLITLATKLCLKIFLYV